jgi:hypothetical protein
LIQIGADEIGKITKVKKSNIIDFNVEEEKVEVLNEISEDWQKNLDSSSNCGVDMLYDDGKVSLLTAQMKDIQTMQREIQK